MATQVEYLDLAMESVPGIQTPRAMVPPSSLASRRTEILDLPEKRVLGYRLSGHTII
jgi:hypothetical protein